jgi:hypothetical protein
MSIHETLSQCLLFIYLHIFEILKGFWVPLPLSLGITLQESSKQKNLSPTYPEEVGLFWKILGKKIEHLLYKLDCQNNNQFLEYF